MTETRWALGMMSGTSLDGVDAALLKGDGARVEAFGPSRFRPYSPEERAVLRAALTEAAEADPSGGAPNGQSDPRFAEAIRVVGAAHAEAAEALLAEPGAERPALVGFHGQTVLHRPERRLTVQLGDGAALSKRLGLPVIHDFRSADVAAGGQGAPFASFFHAALARSAGERLAGAPVAFLNLGGVGNVTWIAPGLDDPAAPGVLLAFDTGPANAMIDDWMAARAQLPFDAGGAAAAAGRADHSLVESWIARSAYLRAAPPKSLDRQDFSYALEDLLARPGVSVEDGAATLAEFTAATVAAARGFFADQPGVWLATGGGRRNRHLMGRLADRLGAVVAPVEDYGFDGDMIEAQAFAHLALRADRGLPLSAPGTTGAPRPIQGGRRAA